eukprot:4281152-Amphidinium_carterae.1
MFHRCQERPRLGHGRLHLSSVGPSELEGVLAALKCNWRPLERAPEELGGREIGTDAACCQGGTSDVVHCSDKNRARCPVHGDVVPHEDKLVVGHAAAVSHKKQKAAATTNVI